jgi:hypothetical protein
MLILRECRRESQRRNKAEKRQGKRVVSPRQEKILYRSRDHQNQNSGINYLLILFPSGRSYNLE